MWSVWKSISHSSLMSLRLLNFTSALQLFFKEFSQIFQTFDVNNSGNMEELERQISLFKINDLIGFRCSRYRCEV